MFFEIKYSFNFLPGSALVAGASSLVLETRLPVSGLRNVSSSRFLDISRLFSAVVRASDETSLSVVSVLERSVSSCAYSI